MRILSFLALALLSLYALACLALWLMQHSLIYFPQPRRFGDPASVIEMKVPGAQLVVSARRVSGPDAVIYFGGNAEDVSGSLPSLEAAFPSHALYLPHYRGYGGSSGKPSEAALFADALAIFDQLRTTHPNITLIGRSLGSGVALHVASLRTAARLVLVTPYDSIAELAGQQFPFVPVRYLLSDKFESWRFAPAVKVPTTIIAASHDEVIPMASTRRLLSRFTPGVATFVVVDQAGHNTISTRPEYAALLSGKR
ncbi:MAG: alpha/beta fold hydrolase [Pseudomonadota bacterium]